MSVAPTKARAQAIQHVPVARSPSFVSLSALLHPATLTVGASRAWRMILAHHRLDRHAQQQVTDQHDGCADCWPDIAVAAVDAAGSLLISSGPLMRFGYTRVSTVAQTLHPQHDLKAAGASKVYSDTMSGARDDRPGLAVLMDQLRPGDAVVVWKLDRLGRNTQHVLAVVDQLTSRGIGFRSLTEGLHTEGPMGTAMLTIMAAFAQLERDTMIERTGAGLAAAAANGRKGGRFRKIDDADAAKARQRREKGIPASDIAKMLGVSRATVYRYLVDRAA